MCNDKSHLPSLWIFQQFLGGCFWSSMIRMRKKMQSMVQTMFFHGNILFLLFHHRNRLLDSQGVPVRSAGVSTAGEKPLGAMEMTGAHGSYLVRSVPHKRTGRMGTAQPIVLGRSSCEVAADCLGGCHCLIGQ